VTTVYGDKAVDAGYTARTLVNDEKQEDVILGTPASRFTNMEKTADYGPGGNVGEYKVFFKDIDKFNTKSGLHAQNYNLNAVDGTMTVVPREVTFVWSTPDTFVYDAATHTVKVVKIDNVFSGDADLSTLKYSGQYSEKNAGSYTAKVELPDAKKANYKILNNSDSHAWKITKAVLTVTANDKTIQYGEAPSHNGVTYNGFVGGETAAVLGGTLNYAYTYVQYGKPGVYAIIPGGLTSANYAISFVNGKLYVADNDRTIVAKGKASGSKKIRVTWNHVDGAASYDVYFSKCNTKNKKYAPKHLATVGANTYSITKSKLKKKTCYKYFVVAKDASGKEISRSLIGHCITGNVKGKYTNAKSMTVNVSAVSVSKGGTAQLVVKQKKVKKNKKLLDGSHADLVRYTSSNNAVASVNDDGVITGIRTGYCKVYVQTVNGIWRTVEVYVK
jgi:hypothetical protein